MTSYLSASDYGQWLALKDNQPSCPQTREDEVFALPHYQFVHGVESVKVYRLYSFVYVHNHIVQAQTLVHALRCPRLIRALPKLQLVYRLDSFVIPWLRVRHGIQSRERIYIWRTEPISFVGSDGCTCRSVSLL